MYLILEGNLIHTKSEEVVYARPNMEKGYLEACTKGEAEYIWDKSNNCAYPVDSTFTFVEYTGEFPADFTLGKYLYSEGAIVENPDYVVPVTMEERVSTLEKEMSGVYDKMATAIAEGVNEV